MVFKVCVNQYPVSCGGRLWLVDRLHLQPCSHQPTACVGHSTGSCNDDDGRRSDNMDEHLHSEDKTSLKDEYNQQQKGW